ncbi:hypothetical protein [Roseospira goensis]|uniref:Pyridoxal-phosphate dependent enzyme n=1 Tax=Roseospira goensis TaxID=391922 RepID=A0A7W6S1T3_9PROT|nr:hypothetical protein [Roseospira goensis]MBB4287345.1 hypothetical protein [Roseospira goensis]
MSPATDFGPTGVATEISCAGCGSAVDPDRALGFRCPVAVAEDGVDHVLHRFLDGPKLGFPDSTDRTPFVRYRTLLTSYHVARRLGLSDARYVEIVTDLSRAAAELLGEPMLMADLSDVPADSADLGRPVRRLEATSPLLPWPTRGLFAILVHLATLEAAGHRALSGRAERPPLVTLGAPDVVRTAVVLAQLSRRPLSVVVPNPCPAELLDFLRTARVEPLPAEDDSGAACRARFHAALRGGALPFTPYGAHALPAREGLATLAYDVAEALHARSEVVSMVVVPAHGGALASALITGLSEAFLVGGLGRLPRLVALEHEADGPLMGAMERLDARMGHVDDPRPEVFVPALRDAARDAAAVLDPDRAADDSGLDPWQAQPPDWLACLDGVIRTRGAMVSIDDLGHDGDDGDSATLALSATLEAIRDVPDRRPLEDDYESGVALVVE